MVFSSHYILITAILTGAFIAFAVAERIWPKRAHLQSRATRWRTHAGFLAVNMPLERIVQFLILTVLYALVSGTPAASDFGLFNMTTLPVWLEWALSVLLLDFAVWAQHVATHKVPLLWRLHKVHHADRAFDITTALRFHPVEIALSMVFKMAVAVLLGVPLGALVLFELLLSIFPMFNHANLALPRTLDRVLRWFVVTPDMHRVHHSVRETETNRNFGFCFSVWDRTFGVYTDQPAHGHGGMDIGLKEFRDEQPTQFKWSMKLPFM